MKYLKRALVWILHLACTAGVQLCLLRLLLRESEPDAAAVLRHVLPALVLCLVDLLGSCRLLRGHAMGRVGYVLLQFWDILFICPVLILALLGFLSGEDGTRFGLIALLTELALIVERSVCFVLRDPFQKIQESSLARGERMV